MTFKFRPMRTTYLVFLMLLAMGVDWRAVVLVVLAAIDIESRL